MKRNPQWMRALALDRPRRVQRKHGKRSSGLEVTEYTIAAPARRRTRRGPGSRGAPLSIELPLRDTDVRGAAATLRARGSSVPVLAGMPRRRACPAPHSCHGLCGHRFPNRGLAAFLEWDDEAGHACSPDNAHPAPGFAEKAVQDVRLEIVTKLTSKTSLYDEGSAMNVGG